MLRVRSSTSASSRSTFLASSASPGGAACGPSSRRASARPIGESTTMPMMGISSATSRMSAMMDMKSSLRRLRRPFKGAGVPALDLLDRDSSSSGRPVPRQERRHREDPLLRLSVGQHRRPRPGDLPELGFLPLLQMLDQLLLDILRPR